MKLVSDTWGCSSVFFRLKKNAAISEQEEDRQTNQFCLQRLTYSVTLLINREGGTTTFPLGHLHNIASRSMCMFPLKL